MKNLWTISVLAGCMVGWTAACASGGRPVVPETLTPVECPGFVVVASTITVGPAGGTFAIQPRHELVFMPGAVPEEVQYEVRRGRAGLAEIDIRPVGGAPVAFDADVLLELSYAGCPDEMKNSTDPYVLVQTVPAGGSIGGRDKKAPDFYVRALIPHLTMFAIAR